MGRRARHWMQVALDSGLPGLSLIVGACLAANYYTAQKISADEHQVTILVTTVGALVASYRVWNTNKRSNGN